MKKIIAIAAALILCAATPMNVAAGYAPAEEGERLERIFGYIPTETEIDRLMCVCMAEGGNTEPIEGLEKVLEVVANRCRSAHFPNTIGEVLYQKNQFQTVMEGTMWNYEVNDKVKKAWRNLVKRGYCEDEKILFFTAEGYNPYCTPAYELGNHYFGY